MGARHKGRLYDHGYELAQLREMAGLKLTEAAEVTSISWQTLYDVEADKVGIKVEDVTALLKLYKSKHHTKEVRDQRNDLTDEERQQLFDKHIMVAYWFVNHYYDPTDFHKDKEDMEQIALTALWQAACYWDKSSGAPFHSYAGRLIKGELVDYVYYEKQARKGVTASANTMMRAYKVRKLKDQGLTYERIAAEMGMSQRGVERLFELTEMPYAKTLNATSDDENESPYEPAVYDSHDAMYEEERRAAVADALSSIPDDQRKIVERVNGFDGKDPISVSNLAKELGKSYGSIYATYHLGMARLRHPRNSTNLRAFM